LSTYQSYFRDKSGSEAEAEYPRWHRIYIGLADHPDAINRYGLDVKKQDALGVDLYEKRLKELGIKFNRAKEIENVTSGKNPANNSYVLFGKYYNNIIKDEFFRILRNDPLFVLQSYFYKAMNYVKYHFKNFRGFRPYTMGIKSYTWYFIILLTSLFLLSKDDYSSILNVNRFVFVNALFAMIPPILTYPSGRTIQDSSLVWNIFISAGIFLLYQCAIERIKFRRAQKAMLAGEI